MIMIEADDEIERMRTALKELQRLGEEGMPPDYTLTFHDKVAEETDIHIAITAAAVAEAVAFERERCAAELAQTRAEIERLQKQLVSDIHAETEIEHLEAEIERLRRGWAAEGQKRLQAELDVERLHAAIGAYLVSGNSDERVALSELQSAYEHEQSK